MYSITLTLLFSLSHNNVCMFVGVCLQLQVDLSEERAAYMDWLRARVRKIPEDRWEDFTEACNQLVSSFIRPSATVTTTAAATAPATTITTSSPRRQQQQCWPQAQWSAPSQPQWPLPSQQQCRQQWPQPSQQHW